MSSTKDTTPAATATLWSGYARRSGSRSKWQLLVRAATSEAAALDGCAADCQLAVRRLACSADRPR